MAFSYYGGQTITAVVPATSSWNTEGESTTDCPSPNSLVDGQVGTLDQLASEFQPLDERSSVQAKPDNTIVRPAPGHSIGVSFYKYGPPGTPHSDFVRILSSTLPYNARPQRPGRTIQNWIVDSKSCGEVFDIVETYGGEFDCVNISTAVHRIARIYRDSRGQNPFRDSRWQTALTHVNRNLPVMSSRHLSSTLWSLATLNHRGAELDKVLAKVEETMREFTSIDLALTAWSLATLRIEPPGMYDEISRLSVPIIAEFQPQALANICWATATLKREDDFLMRSAAFVAVRHIDAGVDFRPHEYSTIAWSMVLVQAREEDLFHRIAECTKRRIKEFGPQELTNTVWAFASLGVKTDGLFEAVGEECRAKIASFNNQNITNLAWSYTHLALDNPALMSDIAMAAHSQIPNMNVQDLAQMALSLICIRGHSSDSTNVFASTEMTMSLVKQVTLAMLDKLKGSKATYPDDAWIVHDLALVWMQENEAPVKIGREWFELDGFVRNLFDQVFDFFLYTPLLRYAQPCGAVVQTVHVEEYQRAFRALDLRSLGIKYSGLLLKEAGFAETDPALTEMARAQLQKDHKELLQNEPGAGSQNWCFFVYRVYAMVNGEKVVRDETQGIRVRSCGGDRVALTLLDAPFEAHITSVKLSNDRLNHRKRDAEFRAMAHVAGVLRSLFPDADALMANRIWWGKNVQGEFHMYMTEVPCLSCVGAMFQFAKRFPKVALKISWPGFDRHMDVAN